MTVSTPTPATPALRQPRRPTLPRELYLQAVRGALEVGDFRFAREAALSWLAAFPGDLAAGLLYARSLAGGGRADQAIPILTGLATADPEYLEAAEELLHLERRSDFTPPILDTVCALRGIANEPVPPAAWTRPLYQARKALQAGELDQAEHLLQPVLGADPTSPLAAVTHLELLARRLRVPLAGRLGLALHYNRRWPECLPIILLRAAWLIEWGDVDHGTELMHAAAAQDVGGQVAERLWGTLHPYRDLWPEVLELALPAGLPATLVAALGWNMLPPGEPVQGIAGEPVSVIEAKRTTNRTRRPTLPAANSTQPVTLPDAGDLLQPHPVTVPLPETTTPAGEKVRPAPGSRSKALPDVLQPVQDELERLANGLHQPALARLDGRFPVYVIFSVRSALAARLGANALTELESGLDDLAQAVRSRSGPIRWGARLFFADDSASLKSLGLQPAKAGDAWTLKLALADLDEALAQRGERIGAVLIIGGPQVVPFHHLPNPMDDPDLEVLSDNPYGTRDENYFIPEWPVGRLPDEALTPETLRLLAAQYHQPVPQPAPISLDWIGRLVSWLRASLSSKTPMASPRPLNLPGLGEASAWLRLPKSYTRPSVGVTAAVWRRASQSVYAAIANPGGLKVSPPFGHAGERGVTLPAAHLGYFNLHGVADGPEWYGQRDALTQAVGPDFPIALCPQDIASGSAPAIVFSEACYGARLGNQPDPQGMNAMALRFLQAGTRAFVGSTVLAYGTLDGRMVAADLLGHAFWEALRCGLPAGEALRRAKIQLANEMLRRQGYLDAEDQKTLISFVLYGDPLAQAPGVKPASKAVVRVENPHASTLRLVTDRPDCSEHCPNSLTAPLTDEQLLQVKNRVAQHLPGLVDADAHVILESASCNGNCPASVLRRKQGVTNSRIAHRHRVVLSKAVQLGPHCQAELAHITVDDAGEILKMVVSR